MPLFTRVVALSRPCLPRHKFWLNSLYPRPSCRSHPIHTAAANSFQNANTDTNSTAQELRLALRNFASSVVVVTTAHPQNPSEKVGITLSSFTSVSLKPPIISFCVKPPSRFSKTLHESNRFVVNILGTEQVRCSRAFSTPNLPKDPFEMVPHSICPHGNPILNGNLVTLHCTTERVLNVGDHEVWMGEVVQVENNSSDAGDAPLVYHNRSYATVKDIQTLGATEKMD
ncbi:hypothetical protein K493DRAFT_275732 [Basidiobolus meristosporus CBS 931.73]|uniref:Flavin reductase like domain-containing protein n=1 Tax=Basidiobolus meristosporus CBS 931.73 TaxID=1314790 RepID=A0A1Y1Z347_9FUNG|nr:hypothetical protein K493DRAFT_275732 [Basidiobolus meristosporus CBS 931.73]|eukprot:ORY04629.1 hypothetical protein K493DRAFT_275732 [Basidiobolus meristosporus CBS 931.73]